jgi:hypothetical protein
MNREVEVLRTAIGELRGLLGLAEVNLAAATSDSPLPARSALPGRKPARVS